MQDSNDTRGSNGVQTSLWIGLAARARASARAELNVGCRSDSEKWEVLLEIRLLGTTFWCGLSNHQAATAQMHLVGTNIVECRPLLGALPLSLTEQGFEYLIPPWCLFIHIVFSFKKSITAGL